ncbi:hypothetical protein PsYK624_125540 [Phanerochaete sordida]|uniref:Uncharacterized protein n=1 Tax=Phanerochaete sordida TaxID=48140 RepID=A0A9P3GLC2_9APHY|nr:hypothetical protein PsYK624_125540 [Phanerochaete sordida]
MLEGRFIHPHRLFSVLHCRRLPVQVPIHAPQTLSESGRLLSHMIRWKKLLQTRRTNMRRLPALMPRKTTCSSFVSQVQITLESFCGLIHLQALLSFCVTRTPCASSLEAKGPECS